MRSPKRNRLMREAQADYDEQLRLKLTPIRNTWMDLWIEDYKGKPRKVGTKKKAPPKKKKKEE